MKVLIDVILVDMPTYELYKNKKIAGWTWERMDGEIVYIDGITNHGTDEHMDRCIDK